MGLDTTERRAVTKVIAYLLPEDWENLNLVKLTYGFDGEFASDEAVAHCLRLNRDSLVDKNNRLVPVRHPDATQKTIKLKPRAIESMAAFCGANNVSTTHAIRDALKNAVERIKMSNVVRLMA